MDTVFDIHPEMQGLIAAKQKVSDTLAPTDLRSAWNSYGSSMQRPYPKDITVEDVMFDTPGIGRALTPVRIYTPASVSSNAPCVIYVHGGSFVKGSLDSGDAVAWGVADQVPAVVVSIDYRLAPEHPLPSRSIELGFHSRRHLWVGLRSGLTMTTTSGSCITHWRRGWL